MDVCDKLHYHSGKHLIYTNRPFVVGDLSPLTNLLLQENSSMKRLTILLTVALLTLFVTACGGGGESSGPESVTLDFIGYDEFRYDPATAAVPAGAEVTVNFENAGVLEHNWLLAASTVAPEAASEEDAIGGAASGVIPGGTSNTFTFTAPPAGAYQVLCTVPGHAAAGMVADFVVE
jgi:plastocyanin